MDGDVLRWRRVIGIVVVLMRELPAVVGAEPAVAENRAAVRRELAAVLCILCVAVR